ncbi:stage V sporulation protein K [Sesbania bispinosa]|nr:stage V sporulation protein K [Sesbania bispinosa]
MDANSDSSSFSSSDDLCTEDFGSEGFEFEMKQTLGDYLGNVVSSNLNQDMPDLLDDLGINKEVTERISDVIPLDLLAGRNHGMCGMFEFNDTIPINGVSDLQRHDVYGVYVGDHLSPVDRVDGERGIRPCIDIDVVNGPNERLQVEWSEPANNGSSIDKALGSHWDISEPINVASGIETTLGLAAQQLMKKEVVNGAPSNVVCGNDATHLSARSGDNIDDVLGSKAEPSDASLDAFVAGPTGRKTRPQTVSLEKGNSVQLMQGNDRELISTQK